MTVLGGNATPVHILDATDLVENGGDYKVIGRVAQRVYGDDTREIIKAIGIKPNGRTRAEITNQLKIWIKNRA